MLIVGQKEVDAAAKVLLSGRVFRYHRGAACERFEQRFGKYLGVKHVGMTASGTHALSAALIGLGVGPGDEVLVPACTYMASAVAVLVAGAIPVIVDIDESITMDPAAADDAVGPRTRAVMPVHMWGLSCDMAAIMRVARRRKLQVIEDVSQAVGGAYEGRMLGSFGHAGAFSFNYYKNMTCGEGGAFVTNNRKVFQRGFNTIDCCNYYWRGRTPGLEGFIANSARASEIEGAVMNAQLDRIRGLIAATRREKKRILRGTRDTGLQPVIANSLDCECGTSVMYLLPTARQAEAFAKDVGGMIAGKTGRHVYTNWDPILEHRGAHHPALNPFKLRENRGCRMKYTPDMCARSLDILNRTVGVGTHPNHTKADTDRIIARLRQAAAKVLATT